MECANHPGTQAAGTCQSCGKALCSYCVNRFLPPTCEACLLENNARVMKKFYKDIIITLLIFLSVVTVVLLQTTLKVSEGILLGIASASIYWGWEFIEHIYVPLPVFTLPFVISGFVTLCVFCIKLVLAAAIGVFVAPWQIYKRVKSIYDISKLKKDIQQGRA